MTAKVLTSKYIVPQVFGGFIPPELNKKLNSEPYTGKDPVPNEFVRINSFVAVLIEH